MKTISSAAPAEMRWTVEKYDRLADRGFFNGCHVQLIEGRIIEMPPQKEPHAVALVLGREALAKAFGSGYVVRPQLPLQLGKLSKPEPDLAVTAGSVRDSLRTGTPTAAVLIVEISDSTLQYDRGKRASLYAKFNIADYWIVNLVDRQLEIHRDPIVDVAHKFRHRYRNVQIVKPPATVFPLVKDEAKIAVAELLP